MNFEKIMLVLKREYITRVRTKSFILSTILTPLGLFGIMAISIYVSLPKDDESAKVVGVIDETGVVYTQLMDRNADRYTDVSDFPLDSVKADVLSGELDAYLIIDENNVTNEEQTTLIYGGSGGIAFIESVEDDIRAAYRNVRISRSQISDEVRQIFETRYNLDSRKLTEEGEQEDNAIFGAVFGFVLGILIFVGLFGYGALLMRSVMEEKTNRIVEVIASSVKPIELMFGKLFGVCLLAITQFGIWIISYIGLSIAAAPIAAMIVSKQLEGLPPEAMEAAPSGFDPASLDQFVVDPIIFLYFFLFFIVGFLIYSGIFAAIGAASESEQDTQQFMLPVMLPIFVGYMLNLQVMQNPDSNISVFASLFPLTAPVNMISRIAATEVPIWQIALSLLLMIGTFMGTMWLAAKIYRVGILMYGKKPTYKELAKWIRQG